MSEGPTRRLSAVWFADIVGYTEVSSTDEVTALGLVDLLQEVAGRAVDDGAGRVVKYLGDAVMAEFRSTESAVACAVDLLGRFVARSRADGSDARLRVGVHLGELTASSDGDIYGDVVNTAARLQGAADPDEVLVSEDVWRQLRRRRTFDFEDRGVRELKGKSEPVRVFAAMRRYARRDPPIGDEPAVTGRTEEARRLVVLPFQAARPDADVDFLAFGLADAVSSSLMSLPTLVVRSPPELAGGGSRVDPRAVARAARVDLVLSGSVQRAGDRVRVSAQLAEGEHGTLLWNQTATRELGNLFELQDDLTRGIVESLADPLGVEAPTRASPGDVPVSGDAYELYLRANQAAVAGHDWAAGAELYREALERDPGYAPAWARLGRCYRLLSKYGGDPDERAEDRRRAEEAFERALELNPDLGLAHSLYAQFEVEAGRPIEGMARLLARAARHPSQVDLFAGLTHATRYCGLLDASTAAHARATELDPDVRTSVAYTHLLAANPEAALSAAPRNDPAVIYALHSLGRSEEARAVFEEHRAADALGVFEPFARTVFASAEGDRSEAMRYGREAVEGFPDPEGRYFVARCWAEVGARDEALELLASVVEDGFFCVDGLLADPMFDAVRDAPDFGVLLERADAGREAAREAFREERGPTILGVA